MREDPLLEQLSPETRGLLNLCGEIAASRNEVAYLVGGTVRDLMLMQPETDLDIVVEGDGMAVAQALARTTGGSLIRYHAFQTARVDAPGGLRVDVATARSEDYPKPGQLPQVEPGTLEEDLVRRDFTINSMAVALDPERRGELVDPHGGRADLQAGVVRVLHSRSFADDPTRILRALRFSQRFGYGLDEPTEGLLDDAVRGGYLDTVSGDRVRRELVYLFSEQPVDGACRLQRHGVLDAIHPGLVADSTALEALQEARTWYWEVRLERSDRLADDLGTRRGIPGERGPDMGRAKDRGTEDSGEEIAPAVDPDWALVLAVCAVEVRGQHRWDLAGRLRLSRLERGPLIGSGAAWENIREAWPPTASPAAVEWVLRPVSWRALLVILATEGRGDEALCTAIRCYLGDYQWVRPELTGEDLLGLGVPEGPEVGEMLDRLRAARLEGQASSVEDERRLAGEWLAGRGRDSAG